MTPPLRAQQYREAARYLRDLAQRLLDYPMDNYKEAYEALLAEADGEEALALDAPQEPDAAPADASPQPPASVCEACRGTGVVPVWDSERRVDWHQQTCPACQPHADIPGGAYGVALRGEK